MKIWILFLGDFLWSQTEWTERTMTIRSDCTVMLQLCESNYCSDSHCTTTKSTDHYYPTFTEYLLLEYYFYYVDVSITSTLFTSAAPRPGISSTLLFSGL